MNINKYTSALIALGIVSAASVAMADSTVVIGGVTYKEIFFTGSTAARANVYDAATAASGGVFTAAPTLVPSTATNATGNYDAYGTIGTTPVCICFDFTGSEAGLYALEHQSAGYTYSVANSAFTGTETLPGTPNPTAFVNPNGGANFSAQADIAMSDSSQAVSLSASLGALKDWGLVGAIPFEWLKGYNSNPTLGGTDTSYTHLTNLTDPQANVLLTAGNQIADYFTGNTADQDSVFAVGRNVGSGTHVNTMLDTQHGLGVGNFDQWALANVNYSSTGNALTFVGTNATTLTTVTEAGGIIDLGADGFDSGSGVSGTLIYDENGAQYQGFQIILLGYAGISDAKNAIAGGSVALTLNGVAANDEAIEYGEYSYWGHEHMYSVPSPDAAITTTAEAFVGSAANSSPNENFGSGNTLGGAFGSGAGQFGGGEANPGSTVSSIIAPSNMQAYKPLGDSGYAQQLL